MGLLGDDRKKNKPDPEPEPVKYDDDTDLTETLEAFYCLGCDPMVALACAWDGLSPSALREFLRSHPSCDLETAIAILL